MFKTLLINTFKQLIEQAKASDNRFKGFKIRNYNKVIKILLNIEENELEKYKIDDYKKLFIQNGMKNPKKTLNKIEQLLTTGQLKELQDIDNDKVNIIKLFTNIYAIGPSKAKQLYKKEITSISQLREESKKDEKLLNNKQKLGLQYYEDLL